MEGSPRGDVVFFISPPNLPFQNFWSQVAVLLVQGLQGRGGFEPQPSSPVVLSPGCTLGSPGSLRNTP